MNKAYERLAEALDRLAEGFPRTETGVELQILAMMFTPGEAALAGALTASPESAEVIAGRLESTLDQTTTVLEELVERGAVWSTEGESGARSYRLACFLPGSFDMHQLATRDRQFACLVEEYLSGAGGALMMAPQPAIHRVVPARSAVKSEWVLPYDDVRKILMGAEAFRVKDCVCRLQARLAGVKDCDFPLANCLWFASHSHVGGEGDTISRENALAILDEAERDGLVHTVSNAMEGMGYVCNCCGCCCHLLRGITDWGIENSVAQANYYAVIKSETCLEDCRLCADRCQVKAIELRNGKSRVNVKRCIGCGLCVTGCPAGAAELRLKPPDKVIEPPRTYEAWERKRLQNRGLK